MRLTALITSLSFLLLSCGNNNEPHSSLRCDITGVAGDHDGEILDCGRAISIKREESSLHLNEFCIEGCFPRLEILLIFDVDEETDEWQELASGQIIYRESEDRSFTGSFPGACIVNVTVGDPYVDGNFTCDNDLTAHDGRRSDSSQRITIENGSFAFGNLDRSQP